MSYTILRWFGQLQSASYDVSVEKRHGIDLNYRAPVLTLAIHTARGDVGEEVRRESHGKIALCGVILMYPRRI